ncbi:DNA-directed RNA polymerases I and III subunit RPAC1 [Onthophagus taurus]|uniref:DNA-directed RNA polymerases I and III subunit RPAC1 n=1 Tax=Onthophagus taurus TaxID=166361 RepID=UPI000C20B552|nr:DNA-directed RNA polymerases I and III subunit RPAC1 [Onthophagus taurus]
MNKINKDENDSGSLLLGEHKLYDLTTANKVIFDMNDFKKNFRIVIVRYNPYEIEFDLIGIHTSLVNSIRRVILSDVPSMAIEKVHIYNNTSIIQDEVLAHRLGLVPLKADPRLFEFHNKENAEYADNECLEYELKIKCSHNKDGNKDSACANDLYKNNNVYSKHIKWLPIGNQSEYYKESDVCAIDDKILIAKMRPGHEMDIKLIAVKGIGRDHAKFSPVATAFYRLLPNIKLIKPVEGEAAERLQKCFSPGVIAIEDKNGKKVAKVNSARYDMSSRNIYRHEDLRESVIMSKIDNHFIFTIESVGALPAADIFKEAITILKNKCLSLLEEIST